MSSRVPRRRSLGCDPASPQSIVDGGVFPFLAYSCPFTHGNLRSHPRQSPRERVVGIRSSRGQRGMPPPRRSSRERAQAALVTSRCCAPLLLLALLAAAPRAARALYSEEDGVVLLDNGQESLDKVLLSSNGPGLVRSKRAPPGAGENGGRGGRPRAAGWVRSPRRLDLHRRWGCRAPALRNIARSRAGSLAPFSTPCQPRPSPQTPARVLHAVLHPLRRAGPRDPQSGGKPKGAPASADGGRRL
jgi:hypothetical protein